MDEVHHRPDGGFALTEVLVAAALLGVGLLGHAALLVSALQTERDAAHRATAATLTSSMAEKIRSNSGAGEAYSFDPAVATALPTPPCDMTVPIDAAARATCDLAEWLEDVASALPGADASLSATSIAGTDVHLYTISIRWTVPGASNRGAFTLRVQA